MTSKLDKPDVGAPPAAQTPETVGTILGIDPGLNGRFDAVVISCIGRWLCSLSYSRAGVACFTGMLADASSGVMSIRAALHLTVAKFDIQYAVIEWPEWEGRKRSARSYQPLVEACIDIERWLKAANATIEIHKPERPEIHQHIQCLRQFTPAPDNKDQWVKNRAVERGYNVRNSQGLGNADQRDALMAALWLQQLRAELAEATP